MRRRTGCLLAALLTASLGHTGVVSFILFPVSKKRSPSWSTNARGHRSSERPSSTEQQDPPVTPPRHKMRAVKGVASRTAPLNEEVARIANISREDANELVRIGAVWARMDTLTEQDLLSQYDNNGPVSSASIMYSDLNSRGGTAHEEEEDLDDYVERMEAQRYRRILTPSQVEAGTDIRVYPQPRRFPACYDITNDSLLYEDTTFLVVDKPPMLPTQPDASNYYECCPGCVNDLLGPFETITGEPVARPLLCHRVDSCVGGCVVLSKDVKGQKVFADLQRQRKLRKMYLAVTTEPVPLGMHIHWMYASQTTRGQTGGPPCQLLSHKPPESRRKARVRKERWCFSVRIKNAQIHLQSPSFFIFVIAILDTLCIGSGQVRTHYDWRECVWL